MAAEAAAIPERRARRWSLLALVLLPPAVFAAEAWRDVEDAAQTRELFVSEVAPEATIAYAGAVIGLTRFKIFADEEDPRLATPKDRALALVRLKARFERPEKEGWLICRLRLIDGAGRIWEPSNFSVPFGMRRFVEPDGKSPENCSEVALAGRRAGEEIEFGAAFVVPRDALATIRARFSTRGSRPQAVEFARP